jgi:magnesium transporter
MRDPSAPPALGADELTADLADSLNHYDGRAAGLPAPTDGVVHPEGPAEDQAPAQRGRDAITAHLFPHGGEPADVSPADLAREVCAGENFLWVDLSEYASGELRAVAESLGLEVAAVRNTLASWTPPRVDLFGEQFYVPATLPDAGPATGRVEARQLDLLAGPGFLISAHKQPLPFLEAALARARRNPELLHRSPAFMLYILLDELLGYYERLQESTQQEIEVMEERANG